MDAGTGAGPEIHPDVREAWTAAHTLLSDVMLLGALEEEFGGGRLSRSPCTQQWPVKIQLSDLHLETQPDSSCPPAPDVRPGAGGRHWLLPVRLAPAGRGLGWSGFRPWRAAGPCRCCGRAGQPRIRRRGVLTPPTPGCATPANGWHHPAGTRNRSWTRAPLSAPRCGAIFDALARAPAPAGSSRPATKASRAAHWYRWHHDCATARPGWPGRRANRPWCQQWLREALAAAL